jgi:hypothetical protein
MFRHGNRLRATACVDDEKSGLETRFVLLCSNSFLGLLLAEDLVSSFAFEAHGMMIRSVNPDLQLKQSSSKALRLLGYEK